MSNGGQDQVPPNPMPPNPPAPGPVEPVVIRSTWQDRVWNALPIVVLFGSMLLVNKGCLKQDQADLLNKTIPIVVAGQAPDVGSDSKPAVEVSAGKDAAGKDAVIVKPTFAAAPPTAFNPDDLEKWLPFIQKVAEILKPVIPDPKPKPTPTPVDPKPVDPVPVVTPTEQKLLDQIKHLQEVIDQLLKPPAPTPVPTPTPVPVPGPTPGPAPAPDGSPKIMFADELGKPITASTVEPGVLFQVTSTVKPENAGWSVSRNGETSVVKLPGDIGYVCSLKPGAWVEFHLVDYGSRKKVEARISCNQGPQPPPNPGPTPIPTVDVNPKPAGDLRVVIVFESAQNHSREQLNVLNSTTLTDALNSKCSKASDGRADWRRWDKDTEVDPGSPMGTLFKSILPKAKEVGLPAIAVACGSESTVYPIPTNVSESQVLALLACGK